MGDLFSAVVDAFDPVLAVLATVLAALEALILKLAGFIDAALASLAKSVQVYAGDAVDLDGIMVNALFGDTLHSLFTAIENWFNWLWTNLINGVILKLYNLVTRILAWLQRILQPLIDYLKAMKAQLDWYFNTFIKPIFDFLQRIRRILAVFRLLGFKWAAKLDQDIAHIEAEIASRFLAAEVAINTALNWISFITNPLGLYNPVLFALSAIQSIGDLFNALWQSQTFGLPAFPTTDQQATAAKYTQPVVLQQMHATATTGVLPDDQARAAQVKDSLTSLGFSPTL